MKEKKNKNKHKSKYIKRTSREKDFTRLKNIYNKRYEEKNKKSRRLLRLSMCIIERAADMT